MNLDKINTPQTDEKCPWHRTRTAKIVGIIGLYAATIFGGLLIIGFLSLQAHKMEDRPPSASEIAAATRDEAIQAQAHQAGYTIVSQERAGRTYDLWKSMSPTNPGYIEVILRHDTDDRIVVARLEGSALVVNVGGSNIPLADYLALSPVEP